MKSYFIEIIIGVLLLFFSFMLTYIGMIFSNLWILVIALSMSLAGAMIGIRGLLHFLSKMFK
ncbi:MAG: hypothetical protein C0171_00535 [Caldisphaera sp.]|jgi:hypothetical protein|uniref:hypothetical protein n=1 Tax=Caldisphaera sp. TaxID=2060322 RepID=UPI000CAB72B5|nr:MAG: hypothetical protein C0171_00535 [Caldisphaera sp.]